MKEMFIIKKILAIVIGSLMLFGCMKNNASDAVKDYLDQYRNLSSSVLDELDALTLGELLSEDQKEVYKDIMKKQYQNLKYEIVDESYDGDEANISVKITVYDLYKVQKDANAYMNNNMTRFYDENNVYDNTKYLDYKLEQMKNYTETVDYTINFNVLKDDNGKWTLVQPSEADLEKIHGIYNYDEQ